MEKLRIVIDPKQYPGKTEAEIRQMIEDAEIVLVPDIDPQGTLIGELRVLTPVAKAVAHT